MLSDVNCIHPAADSYKRGGFDVAKRSSFSHSATPKLFLVCASDDQDLAVNE